MSQNASWYKRCLTTTLMIMINGLVLVHTCAAKEVVQKCGSTISTQIVLRHQKHSPDLNNYIRYLISGNGRIKPVKNWKCQPKNLECIIIKLKNVIDRYNMKESELKAIFSGIAESGLNKSETFKDFLPKHRRLKKDFKCRKFKYHKNLKKRTCELLLKFHSDVRSLHKNFRELINYEKSPHFKKEDRSNGHRLKVLNELQNDLKTLDVEIIEIVAMRKNKRLKFSRQPKRMTLILPGPESQTDLMIREWEIILYSKEFLNDWMKKLLKKCWKKRN